MLKITRKINHNAQNSIKIEIKKNVLFKNKNLAPPLENLATPLQTVHT